MHINNLYEQAKRLKLDSIVISKSLQQGMFHSLFLGKGIEFDSCREYETHDDIRNIDWNLTARTGKPFVKVFREERDITLFLILDVSKSMHSISQTKILYSEKSFELATLFIFAGTYLNCRIGCMTFSDNVSQIWEPKYGNDFAFSLVHKLKDIYEHNISGKTNIAKAIDILNRNINKKCLVIIISDFKMNDYRKKILSLSKTHDTVAIKIFSENDYSLPQIGVLALNELEENKVYYINTYSHREMSSYQQKYISELNNWKNTCIDCGIIPLEIDIDSNSIKEISNFLTSSKTKYELINSMKNRR